MLERFLSIFIFFFYLMDTVLASKDNYNNDKADDPSRWSMLVIRLDVAASPSCRVRSSSVSHLLE
ncbi:unnamed protein product [Angiostrongylus costaricensis]|uniref:Secreted protein n=1 Tax=Angiostrongylus costaricensis TaxID=334426 RepID=A0A0R3Q221_ANGCS|nr:unnamed protein product [Angiostrongylus costaricensis]